MDVPSLHNTRNHLKKAEADVLACLEGDGQHEDSQVSL